MLRSSKTFFSIFSLCAVYFLMVYFIYFTPWAADDFSYGFSKDFSFIKIILDEYNQYFLWTGRSVAHIIARSLLLIPWLHTLLTPIFFCALIVIMHILASGLSWKDTISPLRIIILFSLLWVVIPSFGTVFFWRTGAGNYCYTIFFASLFLIPYRFLADLPQYTPHPLARWTFFLLGLLAGWSNENMGITVAALSCIVLYSTYLRSGKIPQWALWGMIACTIGWIMLMIAPGNYIRMNHEHFAAFYEKTLWERISSRLYTLSSYFKSFFIFPLVTVCFTIVYNIGTLKNNIQLHYCIIFFSIALLMCCPFLLSPYIPHRALTASGFFICISMYIAFFMMQQKMRFIVFIPLLIFILSTVYSNAIIFYRNSAVSVQRNNILRDKNAKNVELPAYIGANKYFFIGSEIEDVSTDASNWTNMLIKNTFGLSSVVLKNNTATKNMDENIFKNNLTVYFPESTTSLKGVFRYYLRKVHGIFAKTIHDKWMLKLYFKRAYSLSDVELHISPCKNEQFYYIGAPGEVLHKQYYTK